MLYLIIRGILCFLYHLVFRFEISGAENIPKNGGIILCSNHRSNNDAVILAICLKRNMTFMAKDSLFKIPVFGFVLRKIAAFPIKRGSGDIGAVKTAIDALKQEKLLCIFPEGTRNKTSEPLLEFKTGAAFIAYKSGAGIIPCAISGKRHIFGKIKVSFSEPIYINKTDVKPDINLETEKLKQKILDLYEGNKPSERS